MSRPRPSIFLHPARPLLTLSTLLAVVIVCLLAGACGPGSGSAVAAPARASSPPTSGAPARAGAPADGKDPDDVAIQKASQEYLDLLVEISPETASGLGLHRTDAELDDRTTKGFDKAVDREDAMLKALRERFASPSAPPKASASARTDLAMLMGALDVDIRTKRLQRPLQRDPSLYLSPLSAVFRLVSRDFAPAADRARNVLSRLEKVPSVVDAAKVNLLNPPRVWTEVAIDQASSAKAFFESQRPFLLASLPGESARVDAALRSAETAYEEYKKYLQKEILPRSNGRFAAGRELFEFLLKNDFFLDEGADDILAMGKKLFADTNAQMTDVAKRIDPKAKGWPEVTARLKARHPTADGLLDAYRAEVTRARAFLVQKDAVELPPGDELEVVDTPPFFRGTVTAAYDQPPAFDAVTKGFFFVTPVDKTLSRATQEGMLRESDYSDIANCTVHETYPGHHLQLSFARRNPSVLRKALSTSVLSEGWALYAEELMAELGYYSDDQRLLQLEWTLVRAARVIIDVGLHVGDMTFEEAVKLLTDEVHLERPLALSEVKRYTMSPTQPLSYLVGRQAIFRMRERYQQREGAAFSLKKFHTDVLQRATVPPSLMAREMFGG